MVNSIGIGFLLLTVKNNVTWKQTWVYFLLSQSLYFAHSSISLEHDVSHYSSQSNEHNQLLVKVIWIRWRTVSSVFGCCLIARLQVDRRVRSIGEDWRGVRMVGDNRNIFWFFSHFMFLFGWPAGSFCWFLWGCQLMGRAPSTVKCYVVLPRNGNCDEVILLLQPLLSEKNYTKAKREQFVVCMYEDKI